MIKEIKILINVIFFTLGTVFCAPLAHAEINADMFMAMQGEGAAITMTDMDVFVATIKNIEGENFTNKNPPVANIAVEEILRGNSKLGTYRAIFGPTLLMEHPMCGVGLSKPSEAAIVAWENAPSTYIPKAEKMILVGNYDAKKDAYIISSPDSFEYSDQKKQWALDKIKEGIELKEKQKQEAIEQKKKEEQTQRDQEAAIQQWIAASKKTDLKKLIKESDFIAIATLFDFRPWDNSSAQFHVERIIKGTEKKSNTTPTLVKVIIPKEIYAVIQKNMALNPAWIASNPPIIFLKDSQVANPVNQIEQYNLVGGEDGVLPYSEESYQEIQEILLNHKD